MESGRQTSPKELSSQSEEDEGSPNSSEDRSSSNPNSPTTITSSSTPNFDLTSSSRKKQKTDNEKQNVSSILPPFYNLQSSNINLPSTTVPLSNINTQTNLQNMNQPSLHPININLTTRQELPSAEELYSISSPLAPKHSQTQESREDFRGQTSSQAADFVHRQPLHPQIPQFGIYHHQPYSTLAVNVAPLPNLSLTYPLPSFATPQNQQFYSPSPQYHYPFQYSMQQPPGRSPSDNPQHPSQPPANQKEDQPSNVDPKSNSNLQTSSASSSDPTSQSGSIANQGSSQQLTSSTASSNPPYPSTSNTSSSREVNATQPPQGEPQGGLYLQSPYPSQNRPPSSSGPSTARPTPEESYYNWQQLPPVQLGRPGVYGYPYPPTAVSLYPPYITGQLYESSTGVPIGTPLPSLNIYQAVPAPSQGISRTPQWQQPYSPQKRPAVEPTKPQKNRFELQMQPFSNQRKSYKSEKRYILPNPITICLKKRPTSENNNNNNMTNTSESVDDVVSGYVTVTLVDGLGQMLPHADEIFASIDGTFTQTLSAEGSAQFSLKVLANSGPEKYRLLFKVRYTTREGVNYEEDILSQPFSVKSNKALKAKMTQESSQTPKEQRDTTNAQIQELSINRGRPHKSVAVWIKGKGFHNPLVYFGDRQAAIRDWDEDLIRCMSPIRLDITHNTTVDVTVSNSTPEGVFAVEGRLPYFYKFKKARPPPEPPKNPPAPGLPPV